MKKAIEIFFLSAALMINSCFKSEVPETGNKPGSGDGNKSNNNQQIEKIIDKLPDFSYAGYCFGEKPIPAPDYKVFKVTDFGAVPDDASSDKKAIQDAINAAEANGSGIVLFPKGQYLVNEDGEQNMQIFIKGSNIILRGEDGAVLFMKEHNTQTDPDKMWAVPTLFSIYPEIWERGSDVAVDGFYPMGAKKLFLTATPSDVKSGDWISLIFKSNAPERIAKELAPYSREPKWTELLNDGVQYRTFYKVKSISTNVVELCSPLMYPVDKEDKWTFHGWTAHPQTGVGVENLHFKGNFIEPFHHHLNSVHDAGWSIIRMARNADSWIKDCVFESVSSPGTIVLSANVSFLNNKITGNAGHSAMTIQSSSNVLVAKCEDTAGQWHAWGVAKPSMNTVIWRCKAPMNTSFEIHASQPRNTLLDCMTCGFMIGRAGGSEGSMPNHMQNLILWNYNQTSSAHKDFDFWPKNPWHWRIHSAVIVGGFASGTTFKTSPTVGTFSVGTQVQPESLYEYQLERRLGKLPTWLEDLKSMK